MKKIGVISDIHVDENGFEEVLHTLSSVVNKRKYDLFLVAGDVSSDSATSIEFMNQLQEKVNTELCWVAGNHDYWQNTTTKPMKKIRTEFKKHPTHLQGYKIIDEYWVIVGDTGWYDYSLGSSKFNLKQFEKRKYLKRTWQDSIRIDKDMTDIEFHDSQIKAMKNSMKKLQDYNIIFMSHMINHPGFKVSKNLKMWDYFNAFLGSDSLFQLTLQDNIKHSISGHVHYRRQIIERGKHYYCACLGTKDEFQFYGNDDLRWNIENAIQEFKIGGKND